MDFKPNISKYKQKLLILLAAILILLSINPPIQVQAAENYDGLAAALINSTSSNTTVGTSTIPNGVNIERTGYLCYMVNKETGAPTSEAKAFYAGSNWISGSQWIVSSRHGGLTVNEFTTAAPWGKPWIPPENKGDDLTSLEPNIKQWFRTYGSAFVQQYFPANHPNYLADTEVMVVETLMGLQFSSAKGGGMTYADAETEANRILNEYPKEKTLLFCNLARPYGFGSLVSEYLRYIDGVISEDVFFNELDYVKSTVKKKIIEQLQEESTGNRELYGSPYIGTVPNLLAADQWNTTVFDSYLNKGAVHAEKVEYDEAGFIAYPGGSDDKLTDAQVQQYGVAMLIIHSKDSPMQTTCNEPLQPTPHKPPVESEGHTTIVKSYREKVNNNYEDRGTFSQGDLGNQILIENEQEYQVVGWKITNQTDTNIDSISWNPPGTLTQAEGTTPTTVEIVHYHLF